MPYTIDTINDEDQNRTVVSYSETLERQKPLGELLFEYQEIKTRLAEIADEKDALEMQLAARYDDLDNLKTTYDLDYEL